jgi:hypothetical protein
MFQDLDGQVVRERPLQVRSWVDAAIAMAFAIVIATVIDIRDC